MSNICATIEGLLKADKEGGDIFRLLRSLMALSLLSLGYMMSS
jgi:hypothetical protein